jgi:glutaminyl-peptide cyclotransferase
MSAPHGFAVILSLLFSISLSAEAPVFRKANAFTLLEKQCSFGPRVPGSKAHRKCLDFLAAELKKQTSNVSLQSFPVRDQARKRDITLTNIIASFGKSGNRRLLFCAHWDSRQKSEMDPVPANRSKPVPGANDGASGVAVLLEIARNLKAFPPAAGVDLIFFDGEDGGEEGQFSTWCLGSAHFASRWPKESYPEYAVLLDMVGGRDARFPVEINSRMYAPDVVNRVWGKARLLGLRPFQMTDGYEVVDDHMELIKVGIPAVDIIDLDYPFWHTNADTPDKCSPESLDAVGTLLLHLIYE